jgi:hypothetical protein
MSILHAWAKTQAQSGAISGSEIETAERWGVANQVQPAFDRLQQSLLARLPESITQRRQEMRVAMFPELMFCRWAAPHTDNVFKDELFLSLVLGTGPSDYRVESLVPTVTPAGARAVPRLNFQRHAMQLRVGEVFLLDPMVPHYACPETPHEDSLLSMLQLRIPYRNRRERLHWIRLLSPNDLQTTQFED